MTTRISGPGFDKIIHLEWLEYALSALARGITEDDLREGLWRLIDPSRTDRPHNSITRQKISIILRLWLRGMPHADSLRTRGLELSRRLQDAPSRLALHWGMAL